MQILNIAGYKFTSLSNLAPMQAELLKKSSELTLKGTILLSPEGINISLAGTPLHIHSFKTYLQQNGLFAGISFRESYSSFQPFKRMKVKIKKEIITFRHPEVQPQITQRAPSISPQHFKKWLDEGRDITILDTRNDYEIECGTFHHAINLHIDDFSDLPNKLENITQNKPIVMFCTGGIRCEKAAIHLLNAGFPEVYQLEGGILNYFTEVGGAHYHGDCFVFDQRVALDSTLKATHTPPSESF